MDPDYVNDAPGNVEIFKEVFEAGIRANISIPNQVLIINLVLDTLGKQDMIISPAGAEKFKTKLERQSLSDFEEKEKNHMCLKFDGKFLLLILNLTFVNMV